MSTPAIAALVEKALREITERSFAGRNPELGKMFKCQVCKTRHRGQQCDIKYVINHSLEDRYDRRAAAIFASRAARKAARQRAGEIE